VKTFIVCALAGVFCAGSVGSSAEPFIIDAGGPRDLLFDTESYNTNWYPNLKLNTSDQALEANSFKSGGLLDAWGYIAKVSAPDGLTEFFKFERLPRFDVSFVINKVLSDEAPFQSITFRATGTYSDLALFDPAAAAATQPHKQGFLGGELNALYSVAIPSSVPVIGGDGIAVGGGFRATSNYQDLPKVTAGKIKTVYGGGESALVSGGSVVRLGGLNSYNEFPITFLYAHRFDEQWVQALCTNLPLKWLVPKADAYELVLSPFGQFIPRDELKPTHSVGLNLVLESLKRGEGEKGQDGKKEKSPAKNKVSYTPNVFVERKNTFSGKPDTKVGAALLWKF
jgi:hypothetical protein